VRADAVFEAVIDRNTADPSTLAPAVQRVKDRLKLDRVVFVGDRGMITDAQTKALKEQGVGFITSLRAPQIQAMTVAPNFQLSLFGPGSSVRWGRRG
jgi:transposase